MAEGAVEALGVVWISFDGTNVAASVSSEGDVAGRCLGTRPIFRFRTMCSAVFWAKSAVMFVCIFSRLFAAAQFPGVSAARLGPAKRNFPGKVGENYVCCTSFITVFILLLNITYKGSNICLFILKYVLQ